MLTLRPYQSEALERVRASMRRGKRRVILTMPTGCHAAGQRVLMFDGSARAVENVCVGDALMGPDSRPREVLRLCRGRGPMYRVTPIKGEAFVVNDEHVLTLVRTNDGSRRRDCEPIDVSVREWLTWSNTQKHLHKLVRTGVEFSSRAALPIDPYFLGVLLGDGSMIRNVSVCKPDVEIRDEVYSQATACGLRVRIDGEGTSASLHMTAGVGRGRPNPMRAHLEALGLYGCDSGAKFIPDAYKTASREARLALLAGLVDTDGHLCHGFDWISKSERLANDLAFVARSLGLAAYVARCRKGCQTGAVGTYYRVSVSGDLSVVPCRIPRKKAPPRRQVKNVLRTGFSVEPVGDDDFYGWTLDGDGRYLLDDFTVTHNSGKTVAFAHVILSAVERGNRALVLAHRRELIRQPFCKLVRAGLSPELIGVVLAGVPLPRGAELAPAELDDAELWARCARRRPAAPVQVASIDTLRHRTPPTADLIVVDECHRGLAKSYQTILGSYFEAVVLGLTATPVRSDGRGLGECFDALVCGPSYAELVAAGALVEPRVFTVPSASLPNLSGVRVTGGDYNAGELAQACDKGALVGDLVDHYARRGGGAPAFAFAVSVEHSKHIAARFNAAGIAAAHVDGSTPSDERDAALRQLARGELRVVSNCDVATEGVDVPAVKCVILARPTKSVRVYLQQVGRGSRPVAGAPPFVVLDHAGCALEHGLPQADREWTLEGRKRRGKAGSAPVKSCPECYAVVPAGCATCPECGNVFEDAERAAPKERDGELVEVRGLTDAELIEAWDEIVDRWRADNVKRPVPRKPGWCWHRFRDLHHQSPPAGCRMPELTAEESQRRARADELTAQAEEHGYAQGFVHARLGAELRTAGAELRKTRPPEPRVHAMSAHAAEEWSW